MGRYRSTSSATIRTFADRAMCAALARPASEEPRTSVLGSGQGMRHLWLLPAAEEPLLT